MSLSNTVFLVSPGKTNSEVRKPVRSIRVSDGLWDMVKAESATKSMATSAFVRYALVKLLSQRRDEK